VSSSTVYFTIGNTDDKLSQAGWAAFVGDVQAVVERAKWTGAVVHFAGYSAPDAPWQNAQWCVQTPDEAVRESLRNALRYIAGRYQQESVAWAQLDQVELLAAFPGGVR
jgi:hypothetical protein